MPRPKPVPLADLAPGTPGDCFTLLSEKTPGLTRDNKPYFTCTFRDKRRTVVAKVWADSPTYAACEADWHAGQVLKLRATLTDHPQYGPQLDILQARPVRDADAADGFDPADYAEGSRFDPGEQFAALRALAAKEIADPGLNALTLGLLDAHADALKVLPATARHFHPFPGGWVEHVLSVTRTCLMLVEHYRAHYSDLTPPLNRDVVIAGAVLHDVGRVLELAPAGVGLPPDATVPGQLHGHVLLGRDLVRDFGRTVPDLTPDRLLLLEHVILSHLNTPAWGAARLPLAPEVLIVHHADDLDAKLEMFARCLSRDVSAGQFTERDPVLGKALWRGRPGA